MPVHKRPCYSTELELARDREDLFVPKKRLVSRDNRLRSTVLKLKREGAVMVVRERQADDVDLKTGGVERNVMRRYLRDGNLNLAGC